MSRLRINSKKFKEYHQNRLDEKNRIVKEQLQEEQRKLKEKNKKEEIKIIFESNKFNWRKENLREFGEWAPIEGSGPTNSTSTTFGYFAGGEQQVNYETGKPITFTYSGLNGVENYPTSITIDQGFGEVHTTDAPPFSAIGVQGYTAKLNPKYKAAQEKYKKEIEEWKRKEKQQESDIEETLKSFGTSWKEVRKGGGITKVGNSYVAIINTDSTDFGSDLNNNVRVVRLVPCDASQPMILQKRVMVNGAMAAWNVTNAQYSDDVYLEIGKQPKEPIESQYLMPRRIDFKDINPQLDASQEFAQKVGADYMMNARVQDLTPLSKNPYGVDYGEIASTNLRGLLRDPDANYSMIRRGELESLRLKFAGRYFNPFSDSSKPLTERDLDQKERQLLRRNVQQLLDFKYSSQDGTAKGDIPRIKTQISPSRQQIKTYGMGRGDKMYSLNAYLANTSVNHKIENNDLETLMGTSIAITDRRGRLKRLIDDFDFEYGYVRGDSGLPGTPIQIQQKRPGDRGLGYITKSNVNMDTDNDFTSTRQPPNINLARSVVYGARVVGQGNPVPINIKFR